MDVGHRIRAALDVENISSGHSGSHDHLEEEYPPSEYFGDFSRLRGYRGHGLMLTYISRTC